MVDNLRAAGDKPTKTQLGSQIRKVRGQLADDRARLKAILDAIPEGVVMCDQAGTITFVNQAARGFYQHPDPAGLALPWTMLCNAAPLRDNCGRLTGAIGVLRDITELHRLEHARDSATGERLRARLRLGRGNRHSPGPIARGRPLGREPPRVAAR